MKTIKVLIVLLSLVFISCGVVDKIEYPHYRKFYLTKAVKVDSIVNSKYYCTDFLPVSNAYWIRNLDCQVGDTVWFNTVDIQERIVEFKFMK